MVQLELEINSQPRAPAIVLSLLLSSPAFQCA
jgi:hypothetical protein